MIKIDGIEKFVGTTIGEVYTVWDNRTHGVDVTYVKVYDAETDTVRSEWVGKCGGEYAVSWTDSREYTVDATPEIMDKAGVAMIRQKAEADRIAAERAEIRRMEQAKADAEREAAEVRKGKTVKVVKGRKIAKGTVAVVFWVGQTRFGYSVGLELPEGRQFTSLDNVETVRA